MGDDNQHAELLVLLKTLNETVGKTLTTVEEVKTSLSDMNARVTSLETTRSSQQVEDQRFWNQTWPSQEELIKSVEARVQAIERERVTIKKFEDIESKITTAATQLTVLNPRIEAVEKKVDDVDKLSSKVKVIMGALIFVSTIISSTATALIVRALG